MKAEQKFGFNFGETSRHTMIMQRENLTKIDSSQRRRGAASELLTVVWSCKYFRDYYLGSQNKP